jgi:cytochrome d ubiquinol oxidase subunit I
MGFSRSTVVLGLSEVPAENRSTAREATIAHWAFDTMVGIATVLLLLALWYGLAWLRRRDLPRSRWFYRCAAVAGIASVVAVESEWITAEVGRQTRGAGRRPGYLWWGFSAAVNSAPCAAAEPA